MDRFSPLARSLPRLALAAAGALAACGGGPAAAPGEAAPEAAPPVDGVAAEAAAAPALGEGFVVWESNRGGDWRIWRRDLDGSEPRRLTPDEPGRSHCCPHIAPDGRRLVYLSAPGRQRDYPAGGLVGELRLIDTDGGGQRTLAARARNYFENRAAVWRDSGRLIHIDGDGATVELDVDGGASRRLAAPMGGAGADAGWLIDASLSWATSGSPTFSPYDHRRGAIAARQQFGGCQPYFSQDGRWGYWTAGAGGPMNRVELASRSVGRILDKNDARVAGGWGYAYFPMLSRDGRLFAWAASRGEHDHFRSDYEVFVAEADPDTLELTGPPLRVTHHRATDRFPDAWQPPLALGRRSGEAPLTTTFNAPGGGDWQWRLAEEAAPPGPSAERTWSAPGRYPVTASRDGETLRGLVVVRSPAPPRLVSAETRAGGEQVVVRFDEPIAADGAELSLASGRPIAGWQPAADGLGIVVRLAEPLTGGDRLRLAGIRDRAQRPNPMPSATVELEPPAWPARRDGLVFLWQTADAANLVHDPAIGADRAYTLTATGEARLDADFAMLPAGGSFRLEEAEAAPLVAAIQATNELTIEATVTPLGGDGVVVAAASHRGYAFLLKQQGERLVLGLRTGPRWAYAEAPLVELPPRRPSHLVVSYEPGRLTVWVDGEQRLSSEAIQNDFFHWRAAPLVFGDGGWSGRIEGVAIYNRVLPAEAVAEHHRLYRRLTEARRPVPRSRVVARLLARSAPPTLEQISPYREALVTARYAVEETLAGSPLGGELKVAQWALLDGRRLALDQAPVGSRHRLTLEPFARQPQLESVYQADGLPPAAGELQYLVEAEPLD